MYYKICESSGLMSEIDLMSAPANLDDRIKNPDQLAPSNRTQERFVTNLASQNDHT